MKTTRRRFLGAAAGCPVAFSAAAPAIAQRNVVRLICPATVGGSTDILARLFAPAFAEQIGQNVIIENRLGAGGLIATESVVRAEPDGSTMMFHSVTSAVTTILTRKVRPYDPVNDFAWVSMLAQNPFALGIHDKLPVKTLPDLIDLIRLNPGKYSYGSAGVGSSNHLATELLKQIAGGLDVVHVPYSGTAPAMQDTITGIVAFTMDALGSIYAQQQPGGLRIVAVLDEARSAYAPELPTAREQGVDFLLRGFNPISLPRRTPDPIVRRYADAASRVMNDPAIIARLKAIGIESIRTSGPDHARDMVVAEIARWTPIVARLGLS